VVKNNNTATIRQKPPANSWSNLTHLPTKHNDRRELHHCNSLSSSLLVDM